MRMIVFVLFVAACGGEEPLQAVCGDQVCDGSESAESCAADCGCGNGVVNVGEDCDGSVGGSTCESVVGPGGTLACTAQCTFDISGCDQYECGNGIAEPGEDCDGADLAGGTCASAGFSGGDLACGANCRFDAAACCNNFCDTPDTSVCTGDSVSSCVMQPNGCLGVELTDCSATDDVCSATGGTAECVCIDRCSAVGIGRCAGAVAQTCVVEPDGCRNWQDVADCGATGRTCAIGPQGSTCVAVATGESCADPYPIGNGQNVIAYTATTADHLTLQPSCNTATLAGPDVVLAYTATVDGIATFSMAKPVDHRQVLVVSNAVCGAIAPSVSCLSDDDNGGMGDTIAVAAGTTYYFYVRDTSTGSAPLPDPIVLDLTEDACVGLVNPASNLSPANGAVLSTTSASLSVELVHPIDQTTGVITITGDLGTSLSFDLSTSPSQVTFADNGRTILIDPTATFRPGETITVSWSGVRDRFCGATIPPPTWTFEVLMPSCTPGTGGMVGTAMTRRATGIPSFTEQFVMADANANGFIYVGGLNDLYRVPKAGGPFEDVVSASGITTTQLGYAMASVGSKLFTLDTTTSAATPFLWRISTSGGVTWNSLGYARYPQIAGAGARAMVEHQGRLYLITNETTAGAVTQIWSVSTTAISLPEIAVLEASIAVEDCDGLAIDDQYFYLTCDNEDNRLLRVDRTTLQPQLLTDALPLNANKNELHSDDFNADGRADVLYVKSDDERVYYVCGPGGAAPFWHDVLVDFGGTTTANHGLGFDPTANVLWTYDDDTQELISIQ